MTDPAKKVRLGPYVDQWVVDQWEGYAKSLGLGKATTLAAMVLTALAHDPSMIGPIVASGAQAGTGCPQPKKAVGIPPRAVDIPSQPVGAKGCGHPTTGGGQPAVGGGQPKKAVGIPSESHHGSSLSLREREEVRKEEEGEESPLWGNLGQILLDDYPHGWAEGGQKRIPSVVDVESELAPLIRDGVDPQEVLAGAHRLAVFKPGAEAKFNPGLRKWLKARSWTARLEMAPVSDPDAAKAEARKRARAKEQAETLKRLRGSERVGKIIAYGQIGEKP